MRIVYDDTHIGELHELVSDFLTITLRGAKLDRIVKYDYGMNRVQRADLKKMLNDHLAGYGFEIGKDVHHANGIGNNCRYPVYYHSGNEEMQQCGYISFNTDMYSSVYVYVSDYNDKKYAASFKVSPSGVTWSR